MAKMTTIPTPPPMSTNVVFSPNIFSRGANGPSAAGADTRVGEFEGRTVVGNATGTGGVRVVNELHAYWP